MQSLPDEWQSQIQGKMHALHLPSVARCKNWELRLSLFALSIQDTIALQLKYLKNEWNKIWIAKLSEFKVLVRKSVSRN